MDGIYWNDQYFLACPICLEVLQVPVTIPCGHSYCLNCIKRYFDQKKGRGDAVQCPQCWETFSPRPPLKKNTLIAEMVEKINQPKQPPTSSSSSVHVDSELECDVCKGTKVKAVKSCLDCLVSYCEAHLKLHNELNPGGKHRVVNPAGHLKDKICCRHSKLLEVFCRTDKQILCLMCTMYVHRGHEMVPAEIERFEKQKLVGKADTNSKRRLEEKEREYQQVKKATENLKRSAAAAVAENDKCLKYLMGSIQKRHAKVTRLIRAQEKAEGYQYVRYRVNRKGSCGEILGNRELTWNDPEVSRAQEVLKQLEQELADLKRRDAELTELARTEDHVHFLQRFPFLNEPTAPDVIIRVDQHSSFGQVGSSLYELQKRLETQWTKEKKEIIEKVAHIQAFVAPDYRNKEEFLRYYHPFALDPATVRSGLQLLNSNKTVADKNVRLPYPHHPDRFDCWLQVLSTESILACTYWEVEWQGHWANVALSYKSIHRDGGGKDSRFGSNDKSWSLRLNSRFGSSLWHYDKETKLPRVTCSRIGVYVDYLHGTISFYTVADAVMSLLHRVQTSFSETLYPGFGFDFGLAHHPSSVGFVEPLRLQSL